MIGRHVGEEGSQQGILGHVLAVEDPRHPGEGGKAARPLEESRLGIRIGNGVPKADVPMPAAAEWLVPGLAAAAEAVVLEGSAFVSRLGLSGGIPRGGGG